MLAWMFLELLQEKRGSSQRLERADHLPASYCSGNQKSSAAQSEITRHARHVASMSTRPDQPNATGIQIITKITHERGRELTADNGRCLDMDFMRSAAVLKYVMNNMAWSKVGRFCGTGLPRREGGREGARQMYGLMETQSPKLASLSFNCRHRCFYFGKQND